MPRPQRYPNKRGVAEGTLFTYFKTKDDLINALYRELKLDSRTPMMSDFPRKKNVRTKLRHVWDRYLNGALRIPSSARCWRNYRCRRSH